MSLNIEETQTGLILKNQDSFDLKDIFTCGQAFRWYVEDDGSYTNIAHGKILNLFKKENNIYFQGANIEDFNTIWKNYFDLDRDYSKIKAELAQDETLKQAVEFGEGIRVLNQDPFETIISFIISANNQIPRIKASIEKLSERYGNPIGEVKGKIHYCFPKAEVLANAEVSHIREHCRVGFRDERIVKSSQMIVSKEVNIDDIFNMDIEQAREELMKLPGVGPKVADCCLLFAFKKPQSFPVDVWIKRVMEELYFHEKISNKLIAQKGRELFGDHAGIAQQYLFYYGRENSLGKG